MSSRRFCRLCKSSRNFKFIYPKLHIFGKYIYIYYFVRSKYRKNKIGKKGQKYTDIKNEYLILCLKCRKILLVIKDMLKDVKHKHEIYQYNVASDIYENLGKKSIEYGFIEDENLNKIKNKISEKEKYLKDIKE